MSQLAAFFILTVEPVPSNGIAPGEVFVIMFIIFFAIFFGILIAITRYIFRINDIVDLQTKTVLLLERISVNLWDQKEKADNKNLIKTACPLCKTINTIPDLYAGKQIKCEKCKELFIVSKWHA